MCPEWDCEREAGVDGCGGAVEKADDEEQGGFAGRDFGGFGGDFFWKAGKRLDEDERVEQDDGIKQKDGIKQGGEGQEWSRE